MNVLLISPNSPFESVGGVERYLSNFIEHFSSKRGAKVTIMLPASSDKPAKKIGNVTLLFCHALSLPGAMSERAMAAKFRAHIASAIETYNVDVICAENFHLGLPAAFSLQLNMVAGLKDIPIVLRLHSFSASELQTQLVNQLGWQRISCVSRSVAGDCFHKGADISTISTDYLGVNTTEFTPNPDARAALRDSLGLPQDSKIVSTASRIILGRKDILRQKGIINTIKAFSKLSGIHPELRLVIGVGQAPPHLQHEFDKAYKKLLGYLMLHDIDEKTVVKKFALDEMPLLYQGSDAFVLASENETFGQVYIEAMASGTAVIGTKVGGIPEIISDQYNGFLVAPGDATVLSQRIHTLITNEDLRQKLIAAGQKTIVQKFTATTQFDGFITSLRKNSLANSSAPTTLLYK